MNDTTLNAILPHLHRKGYPESPDPRLVHDLNAHHALELACLCDWLEEQMAAYPHMVPSLRQALTERLADGREMSPSYCSEGDVTDLIDDLQELAKDPGGRFAQEAQALVRAQHRAECLAQTPTPSARSPRRRA